MSRRYSCDIPGLETNWIEVDETWTLGEVRAMDEAQEMDALRTWWGRKITACHILDGETVIDSPSALAASALENVDWRLYGFLGNVLNRAIRDLRVLGNVSGRLLLPSSAAPTTKKAD